MIRPATIHDSHRIGQIQVEGWRAAYRGIIPDGVLAGLSVESRAAGWRRTIERDSRTVWVAVQAESVVGWVSLGPSRDGVDGAGEVFALYVDPRCWRNGWGRALMHAAEPELRMRGFTSIVLWVLERNVTALGFYTKLGYQLDGADKVESFGEAQLRELRLRLPLEGQGA
ncbi:MAG: GNAT family N-acetyltransferase [Opitutaceae bacterium]|nr:GNAT family N-acetyltransferase [Opitutaceae bacterium]